MPRAFYHATRNVHLYLGLVASPFVLVYAYTAILLNHAYLPWKSSDRDSTSRTIKIVAPDTGNSLAVARNVRRQLGVSGEIGFVNRSRNGRRITFPIETPRLVTNVVVELDAGTASMKSQHRGLWEASVYLHRMPGPHNANIRGNWLVTRLWGWLADASVYAILLLTASGIYLWTVFKAERRTGLLFIGVGMATFLAVTLVVVA